MSIDVGTQTSAAILPPASPRRKIAYVVAPDGQAGGGMGRVKDYIIEAAGDLIEDIRFVPLITRDRRGFLWSIWLTIAAVARIWATTACGRLAFVHVNFGDNASAVRKGFVVVLARLSGATVVLHLHAVKLESQYRSGNILLKALIRIPFRTASHVLVLGEFWRFWVISELGVAAERCDVVYNGVPIVVGPERLIAKQPGPVRILFLGNLLERKGVSDLLKALARLPEGREWSLVLAGGGDLDRYKTLAGALEIADRVTFAGWVDQARARMLLEEADLLVLPSYEEGLPLVILEALGSATPVLCTPIGAIPEILENGRTAAFCRPGDVDDLARALTELIDRPDLRQFLSTEGRRAFLERFSLAAFMEALLTVYRDRCGIDIKVREVPRRGGER